jgi:hypothetical protein
MAVRLRETILAKPPTPSGMEHRSTGATTLVWYRSSSAGAVTGLQAAVGRWNDGSVPKRSGSTSPVERPSCLLAISLGVRRSRREADHPQTSSGTIETKRSHASTPPYALVAFRTNSIFRLAQAHAE